MDGINSQLIIVTHSTDALLGDYRNLIRFYKSGDGTAVISGKASNSRKGLIEPSPLALITQIP